jgi:transposase
VAVIATARKLVTIAYLMLKNNEPYRYAKLDVVKNKLTKCRRKTNRSSPTRTRSSRTPANASPLNDLYRQHGMPMCQPPQTWSVGERRALEAAEVMPFAESMHKPSTKEKPRKPTARTAK